MGVTSHATFCITCRHCKATNRIAVERAIDLSRKANCGSCRKPLFFTENENMSDLDPRSYEHPLDRAALDTLNKVPGVHTFLKFILREIPERFWKLWILQNHVLIHERQAEPYHAIFKRVVQTFDFDYVPELFIYQDPTANAFTFGVEKPIICISSGCMDLMSEDEIAFVMAHELAHIHMQHQLYRTAAYLLIHIGLHVSEMIGFGIGKALIQPIYYAFMHWMRCSELSADRGALLVCRDYHVGIATLMKLAGGSQKLASLMDPEQFLKQAEMARKASDEHILNWLFMMMQGSGGSHPFAVWRAGHLDDWVRSGAYFDILSGNYKRRDPRATPPVQEIKAEEPKDESERKREKDFFDEMRNFFSFFGGSAPKEKPAADAGEPKRKPDDPDVVDAVGPDDER